MAWLYVRKPLLVPLRHFWSWKHFNLLILVVLFFEPFTANSSCFPCGKCKNNGLLDRTAQFVTDPASCMPESRVIDLTSFSTVCDLTCCPVSDHWAYYHKLVDCMVPSLLTLHKALQSRDSAKVAIIPDHLADFYDVIIPHSSSIERMQHHTRSTACYIVASDTAVVNREAESMKLPDLWREVHASQAWSAFQQSMHRGLARSEAGGTYPRAARHRHSSSAAIHGHLPPIGSAGTITFVQRHGRSRVFANAGDILAALHAAFPDWHVQIFHGNETVVQTMAMFAQSNVVIGYHGAGLANALFSPAGTIVLEFTTMKDVDSIALWRTNAVIGKVHPNLTWIQHAVDLDRLDNGSDGAAKFVDAVRVTPDRDHLIKDVRFVRVSPGVLFNAMKRLEQEVNNRGM